MMKKHVLEVSNTLCMKSKIEERLIHQLGKKAHSAQFDPIQAESGMLPSW